MVSSRGIDPTMIIGKSAVESARLFRYFVAAYPARSSLMLLALTAAALAEGVGIVSMAEQKGTTSAV